MSSRHDQIWDPQVGHRLRNMFTAEVVEVEAIGYDEFGQKRWRLSCDSDGPPGDVGWSRAGLLGTWDDDR